VPQRRANCCIDCSNGRRSGKLDPGSATSAFEDIEQAIAASEAEDDLVPDDGTFPAAGPILDGVHPLRREEHHLAV
jgi:hypothetical protein